ncbi:NGG1 interacting factor 3 family protein [Schizosaccharomyces japonicus yFS275]|uniref:NGG1 interacting factor 3 family protein n=1 Tax=Schizosaccharomyces japonicus (strain yFS275 / FY16936) TaxID=402676 RepID=B6K758_SCHJY|nr:NGG1 interacting factor 3 family protein [Schizosaccharomyces japonicus yFS275]EEB09362.1 NGG1 interacting factor 3 family protein [Schizosaccharomyces japonicus yFS275]
MSGFSSVVTRSVEKIYRRALADSWDNTGLLLEAPQDRPHARTVLLTNDLTTAVADEAIENKSVGAIVSYHPIIFRGLKSITLSNPQQRSLLRLAAAGIHVYSPHTAVDAAVDGVNDWLSRGIAGNGDGISACSVLQSNDSMQEGEGYGRLVELKEAVTLADLVQRAKKLTGLKHVQVCAPKGLDVLISKVSLCAGSGGSVVMGTKAELYFTGELSHHQVLEAAANGISVILCGHSNTERGYLTEVMKEKLLQSFREDPNGKDVEVCVSTADKDPLMTM